MTFDFSLQSISQCRNHLMGYAILGVLIGHILVFGDVHNTGLIKIIYWLSGLVHTAGFLFISGFGVFYSLHKNGNIFNFYKRRIKRFVLPFLMMAIPFFMLVCYVNGYGIKQYLLYISTIEFWLHGNYHGMWYIAVSLLLYVITPPICIIFTNLKTPRLVTEISILCLALCICYSIRVHFAIYYEQVGIGLTPLPMFYVGFLFADLSTRHLGQKTNVMTALYMLVAMLYFIDFNIYGINFIIRCLFGILLVCLFFKLTIRLKKNWVLYIFDWLGKYTFEIYILHIYYWFIIKAVCHYGAMCNIMVAVVLSLLTCAPIHWIIGKTEYKLKI